MPAVVEERTSYPLSPGRPRPPLARVVSLERDTPELAAAYDHVGARQFEQGKTLVESLRLRGGERVLDVGCGTGQLSAWVAARVAPGGGEVVGIDPLPLRVELASRKHLRLRTRVGRAEDLSAFADASFDVVFLNSVFQWIGDPQRALSEALRVLRPGGRLGLNSPDARRVHQSQSLMREAIEDEDLTERAAGSEPPARPQGPLDALLHDAGFTLVTLSEHTFVDEVRDADDVIAWSRNNGYGGFLADFGPGQLARVRKRLDYKLDALRTARGVWLERYLVFATAVKPG